MRKIVSVLLCAVLAFSIVPFSAHSEEAADTTINIDMVWDEMSFVYAPNYMGEWDAESHSYVNAPIGGWKISDAYNNITVTNNSSSVDVNVEFVFTPAEDSEVALTFYSSSDTEMEQAIDSIVVASDSSQTVKVIPSGELSESATTAVKMGSITVTFSVANS